MPAAVDALVAGSTTRPRADAQRNFQRLVTAARAAVDEQGLGVTTREIAHRAGVGLGTLYRRVPSLAAVFRLPRSAVHHPFAHRVQPPIRG